MPIGPVAPMDLVHSARRTGPSMLLRPPSPPSIGIGGHLATPPLPHHRAYGSVPRRFGGLGLNSIRHVDQPEATEAGLGESQMQCLGGADAPRSSRIHDGGK